MQEYAVDENAERNMYSFTGNSLEDIKKQIRQEEEKQQNTKNANLNEISFAGHDIHVASEKESSASFLKVGWIGLGQMGKAHVKNLMEKGIKDIVVWNRSVGAIEELVKLGATAASSPKDVVERSDVIFVMLSNPDAARDVYNKPDGILAGLSPGKGIIECASLDGECINELQSLVQEKHGRFVASPVAGHSGMARNATCQLICAGNKSLYDDITPIFKNLAKNNVWLGDSIEGAANLKLVVNGLLGSITASTAEAVAISDKCGIDRDALKSIISGHAMNSPLLQLCLKMMHDGKHDPLFMIQHMSKDTKLCSYLAKSIKQESKIINATSDLYQSAVSQGLGENNWTGVHTSISNVPSTLS